MTRAPAPPEGFAEFVAARSHVLLRAAWLLTGDAANAEDLLQTALARSWRHWERIAAAGNPEAYVRRVLFHTYLSWWRRRWRGELPSAAPPDRAGADDIAAASAARDGVRRALARLTPRQRAVVVLRYIEDRTVAETAELLGCSSGTVKTLAFRALETLRADATVRALLTGEGAEHQ
ncbi:SigE family RNA polymerase sigma factor [Dactylosporangium matsuzakiense]|uniref:DNA-directed RNA polymerase sigma-70 factor n=1 Tax=Dactylosporangium matsuzakiense TaxID=53360 RepID=A0A9W6NND3_9ACTN|nr:SigE family RNA polymerase sigma factor [Dactylosporangium matsuzakiense]UWZ48170.1 SigE family RNA polymerase sigma factor [Dactylosporangium matsuzakiense]GLL03191.1 DNA-directed RNA polymerase sigma-70 factor [Dactylosporangium matsuzakiense]